MSVSEIIDARNRAAVLETKCERMRNAIQEHHDQHADDRCWMDDVKLYASIGIHMSDPRVGDKGEMLANCKRFVERRCEEGGWPSYASLEAELAAVVKERDLLRVENTRYREVLAAFAAFDLGPWAKEAAQLALSLDDPPPPPS